MAAKISKEIRDQIKLANNGDTEAQHNLGIYYASRKKFVEAHDWYLNAADQGYAPAQMNLGLLYMEDHPGLRKDYGKALYWFDSAAGLGLPEAMNMLGYMHVSATATEYNPTAAYGYFHAAAYAHCKTGYNQGCALTNLAVATIRGIGTERNVPLGVTLLKKAVAHGFDGAKILLAERHHRGVGGIARNDSEAERLLKQTMTDSKELDLACAADRRLTDMRFAQGNIACYAAKLGPH